MQGASWESLKQCHLSIHLLFGKIFVLLDLPLCPECLEKCVAIHVWKGSKTKKGKVAGIDNESYMLATHLTFSFHSTIH